MSFTIKAGTVNKRKNSTYVPNLTHEYEVVLKESCSDYAPVFILQNPTNRFSYNYLEWDGWYYYIDDVIREKNHMITIKCRLDPLASARPYILGSTQFVAYDTTANTELVDDRISVKTTANRVKNEHQISLLTANRCVVVGIVGKDSCGMWAMSEDKAAVLLNTVKALSHALLEPIDWQQDTLEEILGKFGSNISIGLEQYFSSATAPDCVRSAILLPIAQSSLGGTSGTVYLGEYNTNISADKLKSTAYAYEIFSINIPWSFTDWRRNRPFTDIYVKLPYIGTVPISVSQLIGASSITFLCMVSTNGSITYNLFADNSIFLGRYSGNCGSNYMMGISNVHAVNTLTGTGQIVTAGVGLMTGGTGLAAAGSQTINGIANNITPTITSVGGGGGGAFTDDSNASIISITHDTVVEPSSVSAFMGTPTMAVKSLSGLSGYVECRNASVSAPFSESTLQEINNYLNGGVYLE